MAVLKGVLREVEISDFRAIGSLKIPLTKVNVLVGRNNTGKTTVIEALALLLSSFNDYRDFAGNSVLDLVIKRRGGPRYLVKVNKPYARISATLDTGNKLALYILEELEESREADPIVAEGIEQALDQIADSIYQKRVAALKREIERLKRKQSMQGFALLLEEEAKEIDRRINEYERKLDEYIKDRDRALLSLKSQLRNEAALCTVALANDAVVNVHLMMRSTHYLGEEVRRVEFTDLRLQPIYVRMYGERAFIERLDKLPVERIVELVERLRTLIPYFYDYRNDMIVFKFGERKEVVPVSVVGDGLLALLELFTPSIYGVAINLVEEPELHMHPGFLEKYARELVGFVKERSVQYVMTTHSLEFLEYLLDNARQQDLLSEVSIIRLYRLPDGEVDYEVLSGEEAYEELEDIKGDLRGP